MPTERVGGWRRTNKKNKSERGGGGDPQKEKQRGKKSEAGARRAEACWPCAGLELAVLLSVTSDTERDAFPECNRGPRPSLWRGEGGGGGHVSQIEE